MLQPYADLAEFAYLTWMALRRGLWARARLGIPGGRGDPSARQQERPGACDRPTRPALGAGGEVVGRTAARLRAPLPEERATREGRVTRTLADRVRDGRHPRGEAPGPDRLALLRRRLHPRSPPIGDSQHAPGGRRRERRDDDQRPLVAARLQTLRHHEPRGSASGARGRRAYRAQRRAAQVTPLNTDERRTAKRGDPWITS